LYSDFIPVVELEEVQMEFNTQLPSFIAMLDAYLKELLGELGYQQY